MDWDEMSTVDELRVTYTAAIDRETGARAAHIVWTNEKLGGCWWLNVRRYLMFIFQPRRVMLRLMGASGAYASVLEYERNTSPANEKKLAHLESALFNAEMSARSLEQKLKEALQPVPSQSEVNGVIAQAVCDLYARKRQPEIATNNVAD